MFDKAKAEKAVQMLLESFGEDVSREGIKDTPRRVAGYWKEMLEGMQYTNEEIAERYGKMFKVHDDPLVVKEIRNVYSHCEHHLALMYNMTVIVAYLPKQNDDGTFNVIGLSKIPRIVELCAKRLQLQERLAYDIAECIGMATGSDDIYVNIVADHACVSARGANAEGGTDTTLLRGRFKENAQLRAEIERKLQRMR